MATKHQKQEAKKDSLELVYEYVEIFLLAMLLLVIVFTLCFRVTTVTGASMEPNLSSGDRLVLQTHFSELSYGDIVVVNRYTEEPLLKRVIGKAGDIIRIEKNGDVYRNDVLLSETYVNGITLPKHLEGEVVVPINCLFLMGDNRADSKDSRNEEIGMVSVDDVLGKAIMRIWPLKDFERIE